jgi:hypothetical protein
MESLIKEAREIMESCESAATRDAGYYICSSKK